jgi:hypothetical protein
MTTTSSVPGPISDPGSTRGSPVSPPRSRARWVGVGAILVVTLILIALYLVGALPIPHPSSSPGSTPATTMSYAQAAVPAGALAANVAGGPWSLAFADGWGVTFPYEFPRGSGCTPLGGPVTFELPTTTGNYSTGNLLTWVFVYVDPGDLTELGVAVQMGLATELGTLTSSSTCPLGLSEWGTLGASRVDSTQAARATDSEPVVTTYLEDHSTSNVSFALENSSPAVGAVWTVTYTTCNPVNVTALDPPTGARVVATVYASNGSDGPTYSEPTSALCGAPPGPPPPPDLPIANHLAFGNATGALCPALDVYREEGCQGGDYTFSVTIANSSVDFGDFELEVKSSRGAIVTSPGANGFSVLNASGGVVAQSNSSAILAMTSLFGFPTVGTTYGTPLSALDSIEIDVGTVNPDHAGYALVALGYGPYSGTTPAFPLSPLGSPIGSALAIASPVNSSCPTGDTYLANGCMAGDYTYTLVIEASTVTFGSVEFEVHTAAGTNLTTAGANGFSILNIVDFVAAQSGRSATLAMTAAFQYPSGLANNSTPLTNLYTVETDMGALNPGGQGYTFLAEGIGAYVGTTAPVALP